MRRGRNLRRVLDGEPAVSLGSTRITRDRRRARCDILDGMIKLSYASSWGAWVCPRSRARDRRVRMCPAAGGSGSGNGGRGQARGHRNAARTRGQRRRNGETTGSAGTCRSDGRQRGATGGAARDRRAGGAIGTAARPAAGGASGTAAAAPIRARPRCSATTSRATPPAARPAGNWTRQVELGIDRRRRHRAGAVGHEVREVRRGGVGERQQDRVHPPRVDGG
jgi:hypothetical protein